MKRLVLVALLCVLLGAVAFAETEDEARAALQNTLMELEETYGAELLPEEQMQLSFLIDWADRYVESEQWAQFAEDFGQCQDAQKLSELLNTDYMGINQAEEGLMQREEARQRSIEIVQAAGFDLEDGHNVLKSLLEGLQSIFTSLFADDFKGAINDFLCNALLTVNHYIVDQTGYELGFVNRILQHVTFCDFTSSWHFRFPPSHNDIIGTRK